MSTLSDPDEPECMEEVNISNQDGSGVEEALVSWREFSCSDDANAWRKSTKEADKHKKNLLQFRK